MIVQERKALFGGRVTDIDTDNFVCVITTAKDSLMGGLSTLVWSHSVGGMCAKIEYHDFLSKQMRQRFHHVVSQVIDKSGDKGMSLGCAIDKAISELKNKDFVKSSINSLGCF